MFVPIKGYVPGLEREWSVDNFAFPHEDDVRIIDMIEDRSVPRQDETLFIQELCARLNQMLACLSEREREVIIHRYGLNQAEQMTLEEIGGLYGVSRERIRQIEKDAMSKLWIRYARNSFIREVFGSVARSTSINNVAKRFGLEHQKVRRNRAAVRASTNGLPNLRRKRVKPPHRG